MDSDKVIYTCDLTPEYVQCFIHTLCRRHVFHVIIHTSDKTLFIWHDSIYALCYPVDYYQVVGSVIERLSLNYLKLWCCV